MNDQDIKKLIESNLAGATVSVEDVRGDGHNYTAFVSHPEFANLNRVQQHQKVYAALGDLMTSGELHALEIKTSAS